MSLVGWLSRWIDGKLYQPVLVEEDPDSGRWRGGWRLPMLTMAGRWRGAYRGTVTARDRHVCVEVAGRGVGAARGRLPGPGPGPRWCGAPFPRWAGAASHRGRDP